MWIHSKKSVREFLRHFDFSFTFCDCFFFFLRLFDILWQFFVNFLWLLVIFFVIFLTFAFDYLMILFKVSIRDFFEWISSPEDRTRKFSVMVISIVYSATRDANNLIYFSASKKVPKYRLFCLIFQLTTKSIFQDI